MTDKAPSRFGKADSEFLAGMHDANASLAASSSAAHDNLVKALAHYSRATGAALVALSLQIEDLHREVRNVAARLDGRQGPFSLRMR
jgi:hypothetical protein